MDLSTSPSRASTGASSSSSPPTNAAASRSNEPANTDSRRQSRASAGVQRSWLQSRAARRPGCRDGWPAGESRTSNPGVRRSSRSSSASARRRTAASSMASGMPSSRRHSSRASSRECPAAWRPPAAAARSSNRRSASQSAPSRDSGGTTRTCSPGRFSGVRLVARTRSRGHPASSRSTARAQGSARCSQLSRSSSSRWSRIRRMGAARGSPAPWSLTSRASATVAPISDGSPTGARSTSRTPSGKPPAVAAACRASRVLPTPPAPASVTRRDRRQQAGDVAELPRPPDEARGLVRQVALAGAAGVHAGLGGAVEAGALGTGEPEGVREQVHRAGARGAAARLDVPQRPDAEARPGGETLLGHVKTRAVPAHLGPEHRSSPGRSRPDRPKAPAA